MNINRRKECYLEFFYSSLHNKFCSSWVFKCMMINPKKNLGAENFPDVPIYEKKGQGLENSKI